MPPEVEAAASPPASPAIHGHHKAQNTELRTAAGPRRPEGAPQPALRRRQCLPESPQRFGLFPTKKPLFEADLVALPVQLLLLVDLGID